MVGLWPKARAGEPYKGCALLDACVAGRKGRYESDRGGHGGYAKKAAWEEAPGREGPRSVRWPGHGQIKAWEPRSPDHDGVSRPAPQPMERLE